MATTVDLDWKNLSFGYLKTDYNIRSYFRNGAWTTPEMTSDETVNLHMAATGLHYGQEAFEGLKAFRGVDGQVRIFRADENGKRLASSAEYLRMAVPPLELFIDMVKQVVKANERFIPPYGTGASLYIRPVLFGSGPQVGVKPADEYLLIIFVTPVGPYYKEGFNPIRVIIDRDHDRAAPLGTGHIKAGGNYGASLISSEEAHDKGYPSVLYLDAKEKKHIDECGAANFFGIRDGRYITPKSHSVLPSITNMSLMTLAAGCVALITVLAYGAVAGAFAGDAAPMTIAAAAFGGVAPIACGFLARKKPGSAVALGAVALIAALIGSIAFRCAMWVIGAGLYDFFGLI